MAVLEQKHTEGSGGFAKHLEAGSESIMFDFLQSQQYQFPVPSAIRELVTNCRDSIDEKQMYFEILGGRAKVSDYYIEQDGDLYKDSKYDPTYYDERYLSKTENKIKLIYEVNNNAQRDAFHIIDTGVGLGGKRLEKHFNPLFSTKRNAVKQTGKFGLGSKAGLALQVDYYTMITRYNGAEFHFNVYDYKVDSIVPRMNMLKGEENPHYETISIKDSDGNPVKFYYLPTELPNGVEVILQAKKGLRKEFIDAVNGQLLYLDGIEFEIHEDGQVLPQTVKAEIEYEDDIFVLPTAASTYYSKPHLILNGICYGYVQWLQLEEEERAGNIGIKIDPSAVDVNPNRESVRWTEKTRNAIHEVFKKGELIAEKLINDALVSTDILDWAFKSASALGGMVNNSVVGRFAQIVDIKNMKPKFTPMPKIKFDGYPDRFFAGYDLEVVVPKQKFSKAKNTHIPSLERSEVLNWSTFNGKQVYYQDEQTSFRKEMFFLSLNSSGFIKISPKGRNRDLREAKVFSKEEEKLLNMSFKEWDELPASDKDKLWGLQVEKWRQDAELMQQLIKDSKYTELYSSVEVPEEFTVYERTEEEDTAEAVEKVMKDMTDAERRKLDNRIVLHSFYQTGWSVTKTKHEPKIKEIVSEQDAIIYGFQEDFENLEIVFALHKIPNYEGSWEKPGGYNNQKICMVSQANAKFFKHHMYVEDFFMSFNPETKTISMHNKLVKWQTARKIEAVAKRFKFLQNFKLFDPEAYQLYVELSVYVSLNSVDIKQDISELENYADKVTEFQLFVATHKDDAPAIAAKSKALFETNEEGSFKDAIGVEFDIYQKLQLLLEHIQPVELLLNQIDCLTSVKEIPYVLEREIKEFLQYKGYTSLTTAPAPTLPVAEPAELMEA